MTAGAKGATAHPGVALSEVMLCPPIPGAQAEFSAELGALKGIQSVDADGDRLRVLVLRGHCDMLLLTALQRGWSVDALRHDAAAPDAAYGGASR